MRKFPPFQSPLVPPKIRKELDHKFWKLLFRIIEDSLKFNMYVVNIIAQQVVYKLNTLILVYKFMDTIFLTDFSFFFLRERRGSIMGFSVWCISCVLKRYYRLGILQWATSKKNWNKTMNYTVHNLKFNCPYDR